MIYAMYLEVYDHGKLVKRCRTSFRNSHKEQEELEKQTGLEVKLIASSDRKERIFDNLKNIKQ